MPFCIKGFRAFAIRSASPFVLRSAANRYQRFQAIANRCRPLHATRAQRRDSLCVLARNSLAGRRFAVPRARDHGPRRVPVLLRLDVAETAREECPWA